jgi:hypothetical protein
MDPAIARSDARRVLRLVNADAPSPSTTLRGRNIPARDRAQNVAAANARAASLTVDDARWIFAQRVRQALEGGKAAILSPDRRRDLISSATSQGMRPFDANLVIAIVQDDVRTSGNTGMPTLSLVRSPDSKSQANLGMAWTVCTFAAVGLLSLAMLATLIAWVLG